LRGKKNAAYAATQMSTITTTAIILSIRMDASPMDGELGGLVKVPHSIKSAAPAP